jgi:hypothetical protein
MRKNIEQRVAAIEDRCFRPMMDIKTMTCPHVLYVGEEPPCGVCDHAQHPMRACIRFITPGKRGG